MTEEDKLIESLLIGGLIGAGLGALLTEKKEGTMLGAIAGAAIAATLKASKEAREMELPIYSIENGDLFQQLPDGSKKFIRKIRMGRKNIRTHYKLR